MSSSWKCHTRRPDAGYKDATLQALYFPSSPRFRSYQALALRPKQTLLNMIMKVFICWVAENYPTIVSIILMYPVLGISTNINRPESH